MKFLNKINFFNLEEKWLTKYIQISVMFGIIGVVSTVVVFIIKGDINFNNIDPQKLSAFGEFVGGFIGVFFTLATTFLVWITYKSQKQELEKTVNISEKQHNLLSIQKFETTFFNMLQNLQTIVNNMVDPHGKMTGRNYLHELFEDFHFKIINDNDFKYAKMTVNDENKDSLKSIVIKLYDNLFNVHSYNLGHYFRTVHNILKLILNELENDDLIKKYSSIFQAQLSNDELGFIFYNSLSDYSLNKENEPQFRNMLDKLCVLENIAEKCVFDKILTSYFPNTNFFINRKSK